jgi:hypothetical protein
MKSFQRLLLSSLFFSLPLPFCLLLPENQSLWKFKYEIMFFREGTETFQLPTREHDPFAVGPVEC